MRLRYEITQFTAYFYRNISKMTSRMPFSCDRYTPDKSKIPPRCFLGLLLSLMNITEDSTYNKNSLSSDVMTILTENRDFLHVANLRHVTDLVFVDLRENRRF